MRGARRAWEGLGTAALARVCRSLDPPTQEPLMAWYREARIAMGAGAGGGLFLVFRVTSSREGELFKVNPRWVLGPFPWERKGRHLGSSHQKGSDAGRGLSPTKEAPPMCIFDSCQGHFFGELGQEVAETGTIGSEAES